MKLHLPPTSYHEEILVPYGKKELRVIERYGRDGLITYDHENVACQRFTGRTLISNAVIEFDEEPDPMVKIPQIKIDEFTLVGIIIIRQIKDLVFECAIDTYFTDLDRASVDSRGNYDITILS